MEGDEKETPYQCFVDISPAMLEELKQYKLHPHTLQSERVWLSIYNAWWAQQMEPVHFLELDVPEMAATIGPFIAAARQKNGKCYAPASLHTGINSLVQLYSCHHLDKPALNFWRDAVFKEARTISDGVVAQLQEDGGGQTKKKARYLQRAEITHIFNMPCLDETTGPGLLRRTYFAIALTVGERVSWHYNLTVSRFKRYHNAETDSVYYSIEGRPDKNHPGGMNAIGEEDRWDKEVWENKSNPTLCPVCIIDLYMRHRPADYEFFYLSAKNQSGKSGADNVWFKKSRVGINYFGAMWKLMKEQAGLEGHITNHSTRRTAITNLYAAGVPEGEIRQKSGHRSSRGVQAYDELTAPKKRKLADILQGEEREAVHVQEALLAQVPKALRVEAREALHVQEALMAQAARRAEAEVCSPSFLALCLPTLLIGKNK
jgi:hypothetical protein